MNRRKCLSAFAFLLTLAVLASTSFAQTFHYWIEPGGHQYGITVKEEQRRIESAMSEFGKVCRVRFERTLDRRKARIKFQFYTETQLKSAFGRLYDGDVVGLNKTRKVSFVGEQFGDLNENWIIENAVVHEVGHSRTLRHAMDGPLEYGHSPDRDSVMNGKLKAEWFNPDDVAGLQKKFRKPKTKYIPRDREVARRRMRRRGTEWMALRDARNGEADPVKRGMLDVRTKAKIKEYIKAIQEWNKLRKRWINVPMAG